MLADLARSFYFASCTVRLTIARIAEHPLIAFPQPSDPQGTGLWRYMDVDKFKWMVQEGRLLMPAAGLLGDPFEGTTPQGELRWWGEEASKIRSVEQRKIVEANRIKLSAFAKAFRTHYYVSCWHMNEYENAAMWKLYTSGPESLAVRTTFSTLCDCLPAHVLVGMVRYLDYVTARLPTMNMFEYIMHKRIQLEFEHEVRAVAFGLTPDLAGDSLLKEHLFLKEGDPSFRVYAPPLDLKQLVQSVVVNPDSSPAFASEMTTLCASHGLPLPTRSQMAVAPVS